MEDKIAEQVASLGELMERILYGGMQIVRGKCSKNCIFEYTEMDNDTMRRKMREAYRKMKFQPPKRYDDE